MNTATNLNAANGNDGKYLSMKAKCEIIRAQLKAKGWNRTHVSVRGSHSSIDVTILTTAARISEVKEIATQFESISRCEYSGEILCGGNTFVRVQYSDEVIAAAAGLFEAFIPEDGSSATVRGVTVYRDTQNHKMYRGWFRDNDDEPDLMCWGRKCLAERLGVRYLDRK